MITSNRIISGLCSAAIALAVAAGPLATATVSTAVFAQEQAPVKPKTTKVQAMTKPTFDALTAAQAAIEAKNYPEAKRVLDQINLSEKLNEYERATIQQTYAYLYAEQENYPSAIEAFRKSIQLSNPDEGLGLPFAQVLQTMYNLGQLYMVVEQYQQAVNQLEQWRKMADPAAVNGNALALIATAYFQLENYDQTLVNIKQAIASTQDPKENWYQLQLAVYLERENYKDAATLLELLVVKFSGTRTYWIQLAAIYNELGRDKDSFAIFDAAYKMGFLTDEKDLVRLARLYMFNENPYKGAVVMDKGFKAKSVERTSENLEVIANAFFNSREYKKALPWLEEAAGKAKDGGLYMRLCQAQLQLNMNKDAEQSCDKAIDKGGLKDPGAVSLTKCIAQIEQKKWQSATASCNAALKSKDRAKDAQQWLKYIENRSAVALK
ncbi:MAG: hypothetical protein KDE14_03570 [Rhodobacteraceae bacterium]|nr:hypothetical protein [Paracoccaceae bacterium]